MMKNSWLTCTGSDTSETGYHSLDGADDRGLSEEDNVEGGPDEETSGGANVGVEDRDGRPDVGRVGGPSVESGPPHPQQPCPRHHQQHVVRHKSFSVAPQPRSHLLSNQFHHANNQCHPRVINKIDAISATK